MPVLELNSIRALFDLRFLSAVTCPTFFSPDIQNATQLIMRKLYQVKESLEESFKIYRLDMPSLTLFTKHHH